MQRQVAGGSTKAAVSIFNSVSACQDDFSDDDYMLADD